MRILILPLSIACLSHSPAFAASFDCRQASTNVEKTVCADGELSKLDDRLGAVYVQRLKAAASPHLERDKQRAWLKERNACTDRQCLRQSYEERLAELAPVSAAPSTQAICGDLPRLPVQTAPGFCAGLLASGLKAPRGIAVLPDGTILVADMGGWEAGLGRLLALRRKGTAYEKSVLIDRLDRPNAIALGPDGKAYVGMPGRIARLTLGKPATLTDVITDLPTSGRHPLPAILFDAQQNMVVNVGSASDHCEQEDGNMAAGAGCKETEGVDARGVLRRYTMKWPAGTAHGHVVLATGLRNSMALALDKRSGVIWQGENSRDSIHAAIPALKNDNELPHDELNMIVAGADYGWPFCYDHNIASPEFAQADCKRRQAPFRLLPAHAAPLGMAFIDGTQFGERYRNSLLIAYHGYRKHGHRIVALLDRDGKPGGESVDLITGKRGQKNSLGAPVAIAVALDGQVFITDDREGIVATLRLERPGSDAGG